MAVDVTAFRFGNANGNSGQGANLQETQLSPSSIVPGGSFGKLFGLTLDGLVYAEPLVKTGVVIANGPNTTTGAAGTHDVVFVATEGDSVWAIDTSATATIRVLWQRSFLNASDPNDALTGATSVTTMPSQFDVTPQIGITCTPLIDTTFNVMYVETTTVETVGGVAHYVQRLHALKLSDGTDAVTPYLIGDSTSSTQSNTQIYVYGSSLNGNDTVTDPYNGTGKSVIQFNALQEFQRCPISMENGNIYVAWASHNDNLPYHGWIVSWNVSQLMTKGFQLSGVFNDAPNGNQAGIWQGGGTLAWEPNGSAFYVETGNGVYNIGVTALNAAGFPIDGDYYNAVMKIAPDTSSTPTTQNVNGWGMKIVDYFAPYNSQALDTVDADLGSGAPMVLPDSAGIAGHPHLLLAAGKQGKIYLIDRDNMGKFDPNNDNVVNAVPDGSGHNTPPVQIGGSLSTPAYYNGQIYWVSGYSSYAYTFTISASGTLVATSQTTATFGGLPGAPVISAAGSTNGIVWMEDRNASLLRAYDAGSLANEIWDSGMKSGGRDAVGALTKFNSPTVANGEVFVGTQTGLVVYGNQPPAFQAPSAPTLTANTLSNSSIALFWTDPTTAPNTATGYTIQYSTDNVHFTTLTTAPGGSTTISVGGLTAKTTYYFQIQGFNGIGSSKFSNTASATTSSVSPAINFSTGFAGSSPALLQLNGNAAINGTKLELTPALANQAGSAYGKSLVDVTKFSTQFTFSTTFGPKTGDGLTFIIQNKGLTAIGAGGGGLGYSGISKSLAIKFATSTTSGVGPDATGEYTGGHAPNTGSIDLSTSGINLHSGDIFLVSMTYDGTTLSVSIKDTATGAVATQSYAVNITSAVGGTMAYVGFTASTGASTSEQDILSWTYTAGAPAAPAAPTALGAVPATATSVALHWTNNATNQTGFQLDRANDANFTQSLITINLPASPNSYTDTATGLTAGATFYYRIRAINGSGASGNSNVASVTIPNPPPTPTNPQVTGVTTSEIDLAWTDNAGMQATGYLIQRSVGTSGYSNYVMLPAAINAPPSQYTWSDTNVLPGMVYGYHIVAFNTSGNIDFTGINAVTLTLAPSGLQATPTATSIGLTWSPASGAASYNIYRGTTSGAETLLATGVGSAAYTDLTATAGNTYYYVVTAVNGNAPPLPSESAKSGEVSSALLGTQPPTGLVAAAATSSIGLTWTPAAGATSYNIYRGTSSGAETLLASNATGPTYTDSTATAGATYYYEVTSVSGTSESAPSAEASVTFGPLSASFVSTPATTWFTNQTQSYTITITNTGTQTWSAASATTPVHLGVYFGGSSDAAGAWTTEPQRYTLPNDVAPGQSVTMTISVTAPTTGGSYILRARMVEENVSWFATMQKTNVVVQTLAASYVASPPLTWTPGQTQSYTVTVTNTGTANWPASGATPVHLGVYFGGTSDAANSWTTEPVRVVLPADVAPGGSATVTVSVTAPTTAGSYVLRERMVMESVTWFDSMLKTNVTVAAAAAAATTTSQSAIVLSTSAAYLASVKGAFASTATAGSSLAAQLSLTNTGTSVWKATGPTRVRAVVYIDPAGAAAPSASETPAATALFTGDIKPGATANIRFNISAPKTKGTYTIRVRLIGDDGSMSDFIYQSTLTVK